MGLRQQLGYVVDNEWMEGCFAHYGKVRIDPATGAPVWAVLPERFRELWITIEGDDRLAAYLAREESKLGRRVMRKAKALAGSLHSEDARRKPHDYCWHLGCILPRVQQ